MNAPLDPVVAEYLARNVEIARRVSNMAAPDRLAAFERIRHWVDRQSNTAPARESFAALSEALSL